MIKFVLHNATVATMVDGLGLIKSKDIVIEDKSILSIHPTQLSYGEDYKIIDCKGLLVTPGLIDSHTHLVFGGNRCAEWQDRLSGVPYTEIAARGGGINSTVTATRKASAAELYDLSKSRLQSLLKEGVTTVEIKSGYGLNLETEHKQLSVIKRLRENNPIDVTATLLAAHTTPLDLRGNSDAYIDLVCNIIIPKLYKLNLVEAVDIFCETVGFNLSQTQRVLQVASDLGIRVKGHTEQLSNMGGSKLLASYGALSVDHIEFLDKEGVLSLKENNVVATLLPLAYYFLGGGKKPPISLLKQYKVPMAVATDYNPGTAPLLSLRLAMNMACMLFGLTIEQAWQGVTVNAALALGKNKHVGVIKRGYDANLAVWRTEEPADIVYSIGVDLLAYRIFQGKVS